ncbi:MAG: SH3 domain-containing protein [Treponema sp.]|nr:SH3 domain-containing protein [Treponema sp.]
MRQGNSRVLPWILIAGGIVPALLGSCTPRVLGWGLLLWSIEEPPVPSGTVLPVYSESKLDQVWEVGIPEAYRSAFSKTGDAVTIPFSKLEFMKNKKAAEKQAVSFAQFARIYGETLQDGLPIRDAPDNGAKRVYRLRQGELIKVLSLVQGTQAISNTGDPLPGEWYQVLTEDGNRGYCFSYRLRLFEHAGGPVQIVHETPEAADPDLERVLSQTWSPESYGTMIALKKIDLEELSRQWGFVPAQEQGIAHIYLPALDKTFFYTTIRAEGDRSWRFEGAPLQMRLRSDTTLEVQFTENGSALQTLLFVALPSDVEDIIRQETARQDQLFRKMYTLGPVFRSDNYGTLSFSAQGRFSWIGYERLIPWVIPPTAQGSGALSMGLFLTLELQNEYDGAFSLSLEGASGPEGVIHFLYTLESRGFRIEYVPKANLDGVTVTRRAGSPVVIYFSKAAS